MSKIATPAKSSAEDGADLPPPATVPPSAVGQALRGREKLLLLGLNALPCLHAGGVTALLLFAPAGLPIALRVALTALLLWVAPAAVARLVTAAVPIVEGRHALGTPVFWSWWTTLQLQTLFLRLPFLEEFLRLVPGVYSCWLRLWGARLGRLTYWAPGVEITDRGLLDAGDDVVLGGKARLGAHLLQRTPAGHLELVVGRIRLGHRVMLGAQSTLGPGAQLADDECTHAFFLAPPFSLWRGGKRIRPSRP